MLDEHVAEGSQRRTRVRVGPPGFAIVVTISMLVLLAVVAIGFLSLSTIQVRQSTGGKYDVEARANARLALMLAIGELQTQMGPDQRVSAPAGLMDANPATPAMDGVDHPHWTGVWSTVLKDGGPVWARDDSSGGLSDRRTLLNWQRDAEVSSYLVSGNEGGRQVKGSRFLDASGRGADHDGGMVDMVRASGVDDQPVSVPLVPVEGNGRPSGGYGFWVSDLGTKANIATLNKFAGKVPRTDDPGNGGYFQLMASQEVDERMIGPGGGADISEDDKTVLLSSQQAALVASDGWAERYYHEFTTSSLGVLADVRGGGLKKDLSVYLDHGEIDSRGTLPGLADLDRLVGPRNETHAGELGLDWEAGRHRETAPRFGMLRDWAKQSTAFHQALVQARPATPEAEPRIFKGARAALANDNPVALTDKVRSDLQPVLVEGSVYRTFSYHPNPVGWNKAYNIRSHIWPRVVLWNPYNVTIRVPKSTIMMQLNTRNDFRSTDGMMIWQWVSWGGGTRTKLPKPGESITGSDNYNDPYSGMTFFSLPEEEIGPGECYVYSTEKAAEYDSTNYLNNTLSSEVAPDPSRNYYISSAEFDENNEDQRDSGFNFIIEEFWYSPFTDWRAGQKMNNQADDARMIWKRAEGISTMDVYAFDKLPQMQFVSCSLQFGGGREPRVAWNASDTIKVEKTELFNPVLRRAPNVRTREGFRLRWFNEHESNAGVLNNPAGRGVFDTAPLANWNPRAAYAIRSPWENLGGDQGDGQASGPWFFGCYTRDLYDEAVGWEAQMPVFAEGKFRGNPFGLPQEGRLRNILFDVARNETGVLSLAQFQHVKLSDFVWHPSYPFGNSLVDPRLGKEFMDGTAPPLFGEDERKLGGWTASALGWSADQVRSANRDEWARFGRGILQDYPETDNLVYDLSFDLNHTLWDEFFLGTGNDYQRRELATRGTSLPNGRMRFRHEKSEEDLLDYHRAASALYVDGAFNVNSTNVEAWKAVLASTRKVGYGSAGATVFPRVLSAPDGEWRDGDFADAEEAWSGFRSLSEEEVTRLAEEIVWQVKRRGPFLSMSDFVNRRLRKDVTGLMGPLQAAIEAAGLNAEFQNEYKLPNEKVLPDYRHPDNIADATRLAQDLKPTSKAWGAPAYLTQADVLQVLGPMLTVRSDSFLVRAYGEAKDGNGQVRAKAWCEAVVQRTPEPVAPDASGLNPDPKSNQGKWGRKFIMTSFRWLTASEV
jgi:hypothetical protein